MKPTNGFTGIEILVGVVIVLVISSAIILVARGKPDGVIEPTRDPIITKTVSPTPLMNDELETEETSTSTSTSEESDPKEAPTITPHQETYINPTVTLVPEQNTSPTATPVPPTNTPVPTEEPTATPTPEVDNPPVIKNLMVSFAPYDEGSGLAGAFEFDPTRNKLFLEFGATVSSPSGYKILPTFEYITAKNALVYAVSDGYVGEIMLNEGQGDYEFSVFTHENSSYRVFYDHVLNLMVSEGQYITAGTQLGVAGVWDETKSRTELMVTYSKADEHGVRTNRQYCPFLFFDPSLKATFQAKVTQHMSEWESFKSDTSIYDEASMPYPGCNYSETNL